MTPLADINPRLTDAQRNTIKRDGLYLLSVSAGQRKLAFCNDKHGLPVALNPDGTYDGPGEEDTP